MIRTEVQSRHMSLLPGEAGARGFDELLGAEGLTPLPAARDSALGDQGAGKSLIGR
jgi:hypothetical protein